MKYLSIEEQRCYGYLLIMTAAKERSEVKSRITLMFSKNNRIFLKRRVTRIGIFVKPKIALNISIIIFMISISCIPVFAYNPPTADLRSVPWIGFFDPAEGAQVSVFDNGNEIECITFEDESSMILSDEIYYLSYQDEDDIIPSEEKYFEYANAFFITENGEVIIFGATDVQPHTTCSHTFEDGILSRHYHNNNRGCSIKNYRGQICQKCKYTRSFSVSQVTTYTFCPH
mgnify:CR=1 FL=1